MKRKFLLLLLIITIFSIGIIRIDAAPAVPIVEINGTTYTKISTALNSITTSDKTTIKFIEDVSENITIPNGRNIVLDLNGHTLSNNGNKTVINNNGILEIKNGKMTSSASSGMINNNSTGILTITSGEFKATDSRQAVYNDGGNLTIMPDVELESVTDVRSTVHNKNNGVINILGGTITSKGAYAIYNEKGTLNIGTKDDTYDKNGPIIQGATYGVLANDPFNVYDGTIKGGLSSVGKTTNLNNPPGTENDDDETKINEIEEDSAKRESDELIGSVTYKVLTYDLDTTNRIKITFDPTGGTTTKTYKWMYIGNEIGALPDASRVDHSFDGWFTSSTGGTKITSSEMPTENTTYFAQWTYVDPNTVAYVESEGRTMSLKDAIAIGGNIRLEKDVIITENLFMNKSANLDLNGHTISLGNHAIVIKNDVTIDDKSSSKNGKITSKFNFTVLVGDPDVQTDGKLTFKGGTIEGLGKYGAIRNYETLIIDGGTATSTVTTNNGYTVYNHKDFTMKSGTVYSSNQRAVQVYQNATFVMDGGLLKTDSQNEQTLNLYGDCSATINGGTIEGLSYNTAAVAMFGNTNLTVNGGTLKGHSMAIAGNGNEVSGNANITVNGGTLIATDGVGIYLPQRNSTTIINGGNISGPTGIEIRAGRLEVNDGNITGTSNVYEVIENKNGTTSKGAAIAVSQHTTKQPIEVIINGGNLKSITPLVEVNPLNNPPEATDLISIIINQGNFEATGDSSVDTQDNIPIMSFITGGTYNVDPSKYVKEGYGSAKIDDNLYEVTKLHNIIIDDKSTEFVVVDKNIHPYKDTVKLTLMDKKSYKPVVTIKDTNGNKIELKGTQFIMPDYDVTISVKYEKIVNPSTGDNIPLFKILFVISIVGLTITSRKIIKA